ncbi:MAG TPA: restriction endonuclease subunit S, partial [Candidatus Dormibacteraeota bacterium]|nr:restriction endonuclease subunit S [Candidatus Dormibacteraeota bacterium]
LNYELSVPSLKEQKKIGKILSLYDEKVESNNAIISNLEELAQTLFKRWFVDFEFPNEEGKPYKSSGGKMVESELGMLPEGWEIVRLSDLMDYQGGSQPPSKEFIDTYQEGYIRLIQIRDYDNDNHLTYIPDTLKLKKCNETDIMIARYGAALGRILFGLEGAYNVALAKVMPKKETYKEFLRCYLNTPYFYGRLNSMGGRSAQSGFNKADIQSFKIGFPKEKQIINDFENKMNKLFQYNLNLQKENKKLKEFRDILLPKLLSGEIELPDDMEVTDDVPIS